MKLRQTIIGLAALLGAASVHALVDPSSHYDNANDFSIAQNPNGVWSYGYTTEVGGSFNAFTLKDSVGGLQGWYSPAPADFYLPAVYRNASTDLFSAAGVTIAGLEAGFVPGPDALAIYRFTAPSAGSYSVEVLFFRQDSNASGVNVYVLKNSSSQLYAAPVSLADSLAYWSGTETLAAGGTLDFAVASVGDFRHGATGLGVQIAAVPEPQTYALFGVGLGLVGMALRRRKLRCDRALIRS